MNAKENSNDNFFRDKQASETKGNLDLGGNGIFKFSIGALP